jgi:hypothetical protein
MQIYGGMRLAAGRYYRSPSFIRHRLVVVDHPSINDIYLGSTSTDVIELQFTLLVGLVGIILL